MMPWRSVIARTGVAAGLFGLALFAAIRLAGADPGGPTTSHFTYAGVLRNTDGTLPTAPRTTTLSFTFTNTQRSTTCGPVTTPPITIAAGGAFTADVPLGPCASFFDGSEITYAIAEAGTTLTPDGGASITPVPYARFADQSGVNNACPADFTLDSAVSTASMTVCFRTLAGGRDEVVKVGRGATAFWIDRYEAAAFDRATGTRSDSLAGLDDTGQWTTTTSRESLVAVSRPGVMPSNVNWFQATALCNAAGKRLMTVREWFAAADGMTAVETRTGSGCNVGSGAARATGIGNNCVSTWGAQDMVGNVQEWTDEWYSSVGVLTTPAPTTGTPTPAETGRYLRDRSVWPPTYGGDGVRNSASVVYNVSDNQVGIPSAALRGGFWGDGTESGVFRLNLLYGPSAQNGGIGFRCVSPR